MNIAHISIPHSPIEATPLEVADAVEPQFQFHTVRLKP